MKIKLTNLFFLISVAMKCFAQEKSVILSGNVNSFNKTVKDVHIINLNNKHGTISNDNGEFELITTVNDTLLISSIQFKRKKIRITENHIRSKTITIQLVPSVTILEEVFITGLTGNLDIDSKRVPEDTIPQHNFVYKPSDLNKKLPGDEYGYKKRVNAESFTNPLYIPNGGQGSKYNKQLEAERKLKRELNKKKKFPLKIKKELGTDFFIKDLKIPEEKIDHFISYCEYRNIIDKYYNKKILEVIEIFQEESINYNALKN